MNVFERVREKQGVPAEIPVEASPQQMPGMPLLVEKPPALHEFAKGAASREGKRFAALTGVLGAHVGTGLVTFPVILIALKVIVALGLTAFASPIVFTWLQATLLAGAASIGGPLAAFLYRYWWGRY
jgi:hypothetical protein